MKYSWTILIGLVMLVSCQSHQSKNIDENATPDTVCVLSDGIWATEWMSAYEEYEPTAVCVWSKGQWATEWMSAYEEYVADAVLEYCDRRVLDVFNCWGLAYIDDEDIPEMVLLCPGEAYGNIVLSYSGGKVSEWTSWRCHVEYIPRSGLLLNQDGSMGEYWDKVVRLENGRFTEIFNHTDMLYQAHDKIDDTTCAHEYYCILNGDTTMRIGDDMNCHQYDSKLNTLFYSKGNALTFCALLDHLETDILEKGWHPQLPYDVIMNDYKLELSVR